MLNPGFDERRRRAERERAAGVEEDPTTAWRAAVQSGEADLGTQQALAFWPHYQKILQKIRTRPYTGPKKGYGWRHKGGVRLVRSRELTPLGTTAFTRWSVYKVTTGVCLCKFVITTNYGDWGGLDYDVWSCVDTKEAERARSVIGMIIAAEAVRARRAHPVLRSEHYRVEAMHALAAKQRAAIERENPGFDERRRRAERDRDDRHKAARFAEHAGEKVKLKPREYRLLARLHGGFVEVKRDAPHEQHLFALGMIKESGKGWLDITEKGTEAFYAMSLSRNEKATLAMVSSGYYPSREELHQAGASMRSVIRLTARGLITAFECAELGNREGFCYDTTYAGDAWLAHRRRLGFQAGE